MAAIEAWRSCSWCAASPAPEDEFFNLPEPVQEVQAGRPAVAPTIDEMMSICRSRSDYRYEAQVAMIINIYSTANTAKSAVECRAIVDRRRQLGTPKGTAVPEEAFERPRCSSTSSVAFSSV